MWGGDDTNVCTHYTHTHTHTHPRTHPHTHTHTHTHYRLLQLQQVDEDKLANEQARNNLESHIFETQDAMYSEAVVGVSTEEQREVILAALREANTWMEEEGYGAKTKVSEGMTTLPSPLPPPLPSPLPPHLPSLLSLLPSFSSPSSPPFSSPSSPP